MWLKKDRSFPNTVGGTLWEVRYKRFTEHTSASTQTMDMRLDKNPSNEESQGHEAG